MVSNLFLFLAITLVMLVWGVASEALREIITGFLDEVRQGPAGSIALPAEVTCHSTRARGGSATATVIGAPG